MKQFDNITSMTPVIQPWVTQLNFMQQSVLLAAIRGPDGIHKNHIAKVLQRWYRRCILISAFEGKIMTDPYAGGGGSFTGPLMIEHLPGFKPAGSWKLQHTPAGMPIQVMDIQMLSTISHDENSMIGEAVRRYIKTLDELPHHYQLHIMHAAQIIGYKHPDTIIRQWWARTYEILAQDMHLNPETEAQMDYRLADKEDQWRASEVVRAE